MNVFNDYGNILSGKTVEFSDLLGKTISRVSIVSGCDEHGQEYDVAIFETETGDRYALGHQNECCETVTIEELVGALRDITGSPVTLAYSESDTHEVNGVPASEDGFIRWTFYHLATVVGNVTFRWNGKGNGYYSLNVDFMKLGVET